MEQSVNGRARTAGALVALGLAAILAGVACNSGTTTATPTNLAVRTVPPTKAVAVPTGAAVIDQVGLAFIPSMIDIPAGASVYFKNSEAALHTVDIDGTNISGNMRQGDVITWTFKKPGQYQVTCDYHLDMHATITVT